MLDSKIPKFEVLGTRVHVTDIEEVLSVIDRWIDARTGLRFIIASGMNGIMEARRSEYLKKVSKAADLFVPDGISLVVIARLKGFKIRNRVSGPDLMYQACKMAARNGHKVFFYGDTDETLRSLTNVLYTKFPDLKIVGALSPPFRTLTQDEDIQDIAMINSSGADILWVGLGLPKQETWIYEHRNILTVPVAVGVGAAFKFLSGSSKRAPSWIGESGFEWLWRLVFEPKRVWRRVLIDGPQFVFWIILELLDSRRSK